MAPNEQTFNKDELIPPPFLNEKYILDILISIEKDPELHMVNFEIRPGSGAGDHYASIMFKIIVSYGTSQGKIVVDRRLILKTMPEDGQKKELLSKMPVFANEISMYTKTLPKMEDILGYQGELRFWPRCVFSSTDPEVIVFDDLTQDNYVVHPTPLPMNKIQLPLEYLAKYHALSIVLLETDHKEVIQSYRNSFNSENATQLFTMVARNIKALGTAVKTWKGFEHIGEKLPSMETKLIEKFLETYTRENTWGYNVLNHGDFHVRNLMFKKDEEENLTDIMFLDFQLPLFTSPALDLYYFVNCVGNSEVREKEPEIIKSYHQKLVEYLKKYGYKGKVPSLIDVHVELLHLVDYDAFQKLAFVPVMEIDFTGIEMSEFFNENEDNPVNRRVMELFNGESFIEPFKKVLRSLDNKGVFD